MRCPMLPTPLPLSPAGRLLVLAAAFLGWFCAGLHLSITSLAMRAAAIDLLERAGEPDPPQALVARWFAWYQCAFLFGAASGGLFFGWLGDRLGRSKGMALSILT